MNITDIDSDVDFLCGSTSANYPPAAKRRNMNIHYQDVARLIWESDGTWAYDDANNTDGPVAYRSVANASASYLVPTTAIRIKDVEIKDSSGDWKVLTPVTLDEMNGISPEEYYTGTGLPIKYQLEGNEIRLFPAPGTGYVTMSSGMAVRLSRGVTEFPVTASTATPGFAVPFHRILSYGVALDFEKDEGQRRFLLMQKDRLERGLVKFYSKRAEQAPSRIRPANRNYRRYT